MSLLPIFISFFAHHACRLLRCGSHLASEHHNGETQVLSVFSDVGSNHAYHLCEHGVSIMNGSCVLILDKQKRKCLSNILSQVLFLDVTGTQKRSSF